MFKSVLGIQGNINLAGNGTIGNPFLFLIGENSPRNFQFCAFSRYSFIVENNGY